KAVITNVGQSHLEGFGDLSEVAKEKASIKDGFAKKGTLIINADDPFLNKMRSTKRYKIVTIGLSRGQFSPRELVWDSNACASFRIGRTQYRLAVPGTHNLYNALAAIAVATQMGVPKGIISQALANFNASGMRMEIRRMSGFKVAVDCYNANPSSMRAALETIANVKNAQRKVAILGDMLELGVNEAKLHEEIGFLVPQMNVDLLLCIGKLGKFIQEGALRGGMSPEKALHFHSHAEIKEFLQNEVQKNDLILVKASRGMKLETVVNGLEQLEPQFWEDN
ncbi:MAG: UDP-N-acetylmuramoyl-tripeptide--D-alanyl-D-alanine ligase, partial [Fibrobacter sp.]|nr:UDP-N-acetylmuramoyl-tripeptide--D-alanyl-D-alanine ligase [Fibrobacter sp.]